MYSEQPTEGGSHSGDRLLTAGRHHQQGDGAAGKVDDYILDLAAAVGDQVLVIFL